MTDYACRYPWKSAVQPFRIAGNLYYVGNKRVSCHLIDTGNGLILIDTGFPQTVYLLLESIRCLGFDPDDISTILHTHAHYDHIGGTRAMVELTGAGTCLGAEDVAILDVRNELTWAPEYGVVFNEAFSVDRRLKDGDRVCLGSTTVECVHTPGHTAGCFSYFFEVIAKGIAQTAGIHGGIGLATLSRCYLNKYGLPSSLRDDYMSSLIRLGKKTVDIFLGAHPEHNESF